MIKTAIPSRKDGEKNLSEKRKVNPNKHPNPTIPVVTMLAARAKKNVETKIDSCFLNLYAAENLSVELSIQSELSIRIKLIVVVISTNKPYSSGGKSLV